MTEKTTKSNSKRANYDEAPTIESLPSDMQFDEALGRMRDVAEWLRGLDLAEVAEIVDDAADGLDNHEDVVREAIGHLSKQTVVRLDFSKPPPGYEISEEPDPDDAEWGFESGPPWCARLRPLWAHVEWTSAWVVTEAAALAAAWAHYRARHDPPGFPESAVDHVDTLRADVEREIRAAAWARYEHRLALWTKLDVAEAVMRTFIAEDLWPECLDWGDRQVGEVERWLTDSTAEMPVILREEVQP